MIEEKIKKYVKCCACGASLKDSKYINGVTLDKLATWQNPTWGNILVRDKHPEPRALAILCDSCVQEQNPPKYVVEWNEDLSEVRYHKVEDLKELSPITEEEVRYAEGLFFPT